MLKSAPPTKNVETKKPVKIVFEMSDGSVYEKMSGAEKFVAIERHSEKHQLIDAKLTDKHKKIELVKPNGLAYYSYDFKTWYPKEGGGEVETSLDFETLESFNLNPNPTSGIFTISFDVLQESNIQLNLYTIDGSLISRLYSGTVGNGEFRFDINSQKFYSGVYLCQLVLNDKVYVRKIVFN